MSSTERRNGGGGGDVGGYAAGGIGAVYLILGVCVWLGFRIGQLLGDPPRPMAGPLTLPIELVSGKLTPIPERGGIAAVVVCFVLVTASLVAFAAFMRRRKPKRSIDRAAAHMGRGRELGRLTRREVTQKATELGVTASPGLPLGRAIAGNTELLADWESSAVGLAGARVGKTTSIVVPWIMAAPGACLYTTNRRDVSDAVRGSRPGRHLLFDPQSIVGEKPAFYVDFLQDYVMSGPQGSEVKAQALANIFATATAPPDSRADRFFDPNGQKLLGHLLHAAALKGYALTKVYEWVVDERNMEAAKILTAEKFELSAKSVLAIINSPEKQRGGIFATAELCISWLTNRAAVEWLTPAPGRPKFDPAAFAASHDTIGLVSREGGGTLSALTTALTATICEAAEYLASRSPRGRLPVPMTCVLDEAANVCRWPALPDVYSHYGGRGIILISILQSWSQGVGVWGERALTAMWSAASVNLFLGGVREVKFLKELGELIGTYRVQQTSSSSSRNGRSTSYSETQEEILSTADLGAIPRGRALLLASGVRPTLVRTIPWWETKDAAAIKASIAQHDPTATSAAAETAAEAAEWDVAPAGAGWAA